MTKYSGKFFCAFVTGFLMLISAYSPAQDTSSDEIKLNGYACRPYNLHGADKINPFAGEMSVDIRFDFDPTIKDQENKTILRNQNFVSFKLNDGSGKSLATLYSCLDSICFNVRNDKGDLIAYAGNRYPFEGNKWYNIKLKWGDILRIYVNDREIASTETSGLAAQLLPDKIKVFLGAVEAKSKGVENRFSIKNINFTSSENEKLSCIPKTTFSLIEDELPVLDGKLNDPFWNKAGKVTGFVGFSKFELVAEQPYVLGAYTKNGIYLGMETPVQGTAINAILKERDAGVYTEDALEIRFEPEKGKIYTFITSAIGTQFDAIVENGNLNINYNPEWEVKTSCANGKWTAEIFIPFKSFGLDAPPAPGTIWRGNYCIDSSNGYSYSTSWAFTNGNFCDRNYFGEFVFSGGQRTLRLDEVKGFVQGVPECRFHLCGPFPPVITLKCKTYDSNGIPVSEYTFPLRDVNRAIYKTASLNPGRHKISISGIDDENNEWFRQHFYFVPKINTSMNVENYPYAGFAKVEISSGKYAATASKARICVSDRKKKELKLNQELFYEKGKAECNIETKDFEPGTYLLSAEIIDTNGQLLEKVEKSMVIYPKPSWWMNTLGLDHTVPPPWTPLKEIPSGFTVWGRDYIFGNGLFPSQILNQKKEMFASVPTLTLNGKDIFTINAAGMEKYNDEITFSGSAEIQGFKVSCKSKLEFDGFLRYDFSIEPGKTGKVDSLILEIPLERNLAQYLHTSNGGSGNVQQIDNDMTMGFIPNMWIGNYDMGIAVVFESDQFWLPADKTNKIQFLKGKDNFLLRFNIIASPVYLQDKATISFAILPTPVKNVSHDPFIHTKWGSSAAWQKEDDFVVRPENLVYPCPKGISGKQGSVEFWIKINKESNEIFNIICGNEKIALEINETKQFRLRIKDKNIFKTESSDIKEGFSFLGLYWQNSNISMYLDGKEIASANLDGVLQDWTTITENPKSLLVFGCADISGWKKHNDITIDEIKVSSSFPSTHSIPATPFQLDKEVLLGDHLDDSFRPDGSDAETSSGGIPSIGTSFVPGKFGNGLRIITETPTRSTIIRQEAGNGFELNEGWHKDSRKIGLYPPNILGTLAPDVQEVINAAHKCGWRAIPYFVISMLGVGTGVEKQFVAEWCIKPVNIVPFPPPEGYYIVYVSPAARGYSDYLAAGVEHLMKDYGFDGIYTDGFCHVDSTSNQMYGAGYIGEDGKRHVTWPFFGCRETMKRLYKIVKKLNPEKGFVVNHTSFSTEITSLSFSDLYYTGEHEDYENLNTAKIRFRGEAWGLEVKILGASNHAWSSLHKMIAMLHGTDVWGYGITGRKDMCRKFVNIRKAYEKADYKTAEWIPYFKGEGIYYKEPDNETKVSMYLHKNKDAFLIIGNLAKEARTVSIPLVLKAMGLDSGTLKARNALTDVPMKISSDGILEAKIKGKSFVLVNISLQ